MTALLGLASAVTMGVLLYVGRDYTPPTEPGWWWNTLVACGLLTGVFWIASIAFGSGRRSAPAAPPPSAVGADSRPAPPQRGALHAWSEAPPPSAGYEPGPGTPVAPHWDDPEDPTRWDLAATSAGLLDDEPPERPEEPLQYTAVYRRFDGGWAVEVEEVPGCFARASTLYETREAAVRALTEAGHDVEAVEVVDDVELPPEAADAINAAYSDDHALPQAAALLVEELELEESDAAALLGVSRAEVEKALLEVDPMGHADDLEDADEPDAGELGREIAVEHISPYDAPASR